uniref:Jacalin-type lectin domain-containing protein n=1 Tax=Cannabis sativa TaxID=3483 RepID=A0A803PUJ6_CANSA
MGVAQIVLNWPVEYLISISGTHGKFNDIPDDVILSLSFQTNLKTYGPFGTTTGRGEPFTAPIGGEDSLVVGFFGRSGYYLDALGIYVKPQANISFGEWGGPGGDPFGFTVGRSWIKQITVYQDSSNIKSLSFKDGNDNEYGPFGGNNPNNVGLPTTIEFERGSAEYLTSISGTYGKYLNLTVITSISFITNLKTYGPFGGKTGTPFSLPIQGGVVVGFHGKSGDFVDSIGVYVKPHQEGVISLGPYGNRTGAGGNPWSFKLSSGTGISQIIIHEKENIKSISFEDATGFFSGTFGGMDPNSKGQERRILLNWPVEHLISISGTQGEYTNVAHDVVRSLTFQTNLKTYGPFGNPNVGEPFTLPIGEDSVLAGFFGRSGYYLGALGIYVRPERSISFGEWGGPGGDPFGFTVGRSWIKHITIYQDSSNIKSLSFKDGNDHKYGPFGGKNPNKCWSTNKSDFVDSIGIYVKPVGRLNKPLIALDESHAHERPHAIGPAISINIVTHISICKYDSWHIFPSPTQMKSTVPSTIAITEEMSALIITQSVLKAYEFAVVESCLVS